MQVIKKAQPTNNNSQVDPISPALDLLNYIVTHRIKGFTIEQLALMRALTHSPYPLTNKQKSLVYTLAVKAKGEIKGEVSGLSFTYPPSDEKLPSQIRKEAIDQLARQGRQVPIERRSRIPRNQAFVSTNPQQAKVSGPYDTGWRPTSSKASKPRKVREIPIYTKPQLHPELRDLDRKGQGVMSRILATRAPSECNYEVAERRAQQWAKEQAKAEDTQPTNSNSQPEAPVPPKENKELADLLSAI